MNEPAVALSQQPSVDHDNIVVLESATWADFQRLLEMRGDRSVPRFAYADGRLEIMTPSRSHESIKSMIGCLVEAWCMERGVDITPYGSWTLEDEDVARGVEPDECYVIGTVEEPDRPDLAIEVVWTSGGIAKLDAYRLLGVREVWYWQRGSLTVHALRGEVFVEIEASEVLEGIDLPQLSRFIFIKPMTRAIREFRAALRG